MRGIVVFSFDITDDLKVKLKKLAKKDWERVAIVNKKIKEIVNSNRQSIEHYKNLRHDLKEFKRVHIDKSFVLTFKVDLARDFILFVDLDHHDKVY